MYQCLCLPWEYTDKQTELVPELEEGLRERSHPNREKRGARGGGVSRATNGRAKVRVAQLCPTLCDPMDYPDHGILQARILEWVAFPFSRASS